MKISELENCHSAIVMDKWTILNSNNDSTGFHVFYDGKEIEYLTNFSMTVSVNEPIEISLRAFVKPRR